MKMIRSLIYREYKLTRKHYMLILILFVLVEALFAIPFIAAGKEDIAGAEKTEIVLMGLIVSAIGGFAAGMNNGIHKADINSGWKRYYYVLPPTVKQKTASDLLMKLLSIVAIGALAAGYAVLAQIVTGHSAIMHTMNFYLIISAVSLLFDTVYCGILSIAKDKRELKKYSVIAGVLGMGLLRFVPGFEFPKNDQEGDLTSNMTGILKIGSVKVTIIAAAAFAVMCAAYFIVMYKSYERREP